MNELLVPRWIKERESADKLRESQREAEQRKLEADLLRLQKDAPAYCEQLRKELARNTDAIPCMRIGGKNLAGNTTALPSPGDEISFRISVSVPGVYPKRIDTDVFCRSDHVECSTLNGKRRRFYFCVRDSVVGVLPEVPDHITVPLTAEQFAEMIVREMVDSLSGTRENMISFNK